MISLESYGWLPRQNGRWIHPDLAPLEGGRRMVFTEAEALTLTAAQIDGVCADCGTVHEPAPVDR
jgi:hypothetical protein